MSNLNNKEAKKIRKILKGFGGRWRPNKKRKKSCSLENLYSARNPNYKTKRKKRIMVIY